METFTLHFYIKKEKIRKDGTCPIYARITVNRKRAEIAIKRFIFPTEWDSRRGEAKGKKSFYRELNAYLDAVRTKLYRHHRDLMDRKEEITAQTLKEAFTGKAKNKGKTLLEVFQFHNQRMEELVGQEYALGTLQRFQTVYKHLTEFIEYAYQRKDMYLVDLRFRFITDFDHYLRTIRKIGNNTTVKYIALFRKIIFLSVENDWLVKDPFAQYKGRVRAIDRDFLTQEELNQLKNKSFPTARLEQVRDIFVFACYTGLAYADVAKLTPDNLQRHVDGSFWINVNRTKTDTKSLIPVLTPAMTIIERYADSPERHIKNQLLPIRSNQKMNAYLKEIADVCGIEKKLTFHMARHTFATTITLSNGVPIESVSAMLGHRNIKTTQHYAKIVQAKVGNDMKALEEKLSGTSDKIKKLSS
ncbi:MAG: site-specific integrase [Bacteroidota bacterium]